MERLRQGYVERLAHTLALLRTLELQQPEDRSRAREIVHRLAGSAGAYGFAELADAARRAEEALDELLPRQLHLLIDELERLTGGGSEP